MRTKSKPKPISTTRPLQSAAKIDSDPTLDASEKKTQKDAVAAETAKAKTVVDQAQDDNGVKQAKAAGIATIDAQHRSGKSLDLRKANAKKNINDKVAQVTAAIDQDTTLATPEKDAQKQAAADEAVKAKTAIDLAQTIEAINQATTDGSKAIDDQHQSRADFDKQKEQAKQAIDDEAAKANAAIDQDSTLTAAEKKTQKQAVLDAAAKAKTAIEQAKDADEADQKQADGIKAIDGQHQFGIALTKQKATAKQAIDDEAANVKGDIDQDVTLTAAEKKTQKQVVDDEAAKVKSALDAAKDADGVIQIQSDGIKAVDDQHQAGTDLAVRKAEAQKAIDAEATLETDVIDQDVTLISSEKAIQKQAIKDKATAAKDAIIKAQDMDGVNQAEADGIKAIDSVHQSGMLLDTRKTDAKQAIDAELTKVNQTIDHDVTLTGAEKTAQKQAAANAATTAKNAIDAAGDADTVDQVKDDGLKAIAGAHQSRTLLDTHKANAKHAIDAAAAKVAAAIDQDATLTVADKALQKQAVTDEATKAKVSIDAAKDADAIDQAQNDGVKQINAQHQLGTALDVRKDDAKQAINAQAEKIRDAIDRDATLTTAMKQAQKQAVADEVTKAKTAIDAGKSADMVDQAKVDGIKAIADQHQTGKTLADRRSDAKKAIADDAKKVAQAIDQDVTLTNADKDAQKQAVNDAADKAKQAIDTAQGADAVDQAIANGSKHIADQHQAGTALATRKDDAKKVIDAEAAKIANDIDQDITLTAAEKQTQKQNVVNEAAKAKAAIDGAQDAEGVVTIQADGTQAI
ncbi:DUF1542 domain-containing protein [Lacticaseibacillus chiayiensis]|uniref:DUF1542 domain-containing protein n=1 Tax=Lacticaseibacillus chiayiensis TaxID=2100821 RepID=UPI003C78451E